MINNNLLITELRTVHLDSSSLEYLTNAVGFQNKCTIGCPGFLSHFENNYLESLQFDSDL